MDPDSSKVLPEKIQQYNMKYDEYMVGKVLIYVLHGRNSPVMIPLPSLGGFYVYFHPSTWSQDDMFGDVMRCL